MLKLIIFSPLVCLKLETLVLYCEGVMYFVLVICMSAQANPIFKNSQALTGNGQGFLFSGSTFRLPH
jgi:hypothetical protein